MPGHWAWLWGALKKSCTADDTQHAIQTLCIASQFKHSNIVHKIYNSHIQTFWFALQFKLSNIAFGKFEHEKNAILFCTWNNEPLWNPFKSKIKILRWVFGMKLKPQNKVIVQNQYILLSFWRGSDVGGLQDFLVNLYSASPSILSSLPFSKQSAIGDLQWADCKLASLASLALSRRI